MDFASIARVIGKRGAIKISTLTIDVEVLNHKNSYGKDRWLVKPVAGGGEMWVEQVDIYQG